MLDVKSQINHLTNDKAKSQEVQRCCDGSF